MDKLLLLAISFTLLLLFQGLYLLTFSTKEGYSEFTLIALAVVLTPITLVWIGFSLFKHYQIPWSAYLVSGLLVMAIFELLLPVSPLSTTLISHRQQTTIDGAIVSNIHDQPFLSPVGNPIGIRIRYEVQFPRDGIFSVSSTVYATNSAYHHYQTSMSHFAEQSVEPAPQQDEDGGRYFKQGVRYRFTDDILPGFIYINRYNTKDQKKGAICLHETASQTISQENLRILLTSDTASGYEIEIHIGANSYFVTRRAVQQTSGRLYSLADFYRNAAMEGALPCKF